MLEALHVYDDLEPKSAALNMAIDEALLAEAAAPILRFYRWQKPAISFGYFGRYADAADEANGRDIVRRWTGGGIVPHGDDVTYSIMVPSAHPLLAQSSPEIYAAVHEAIRVALLTNRIEARLAEQATPKISDACFANAVRADLLSGDRKIAGAAHRRARAGLLHQGSIQRNDLPERFREDFARLLCERFERKTLGAETLDRAAQIAASKYGTREWLMRR
jgi:lipoyl(octanoyl) transferase